MDHISKIHLTEAQHKGPVLNKEDKSKDTEKKKTGDIKCKNGKIAQCSWARNNKCKYDHKGEFVQNVENIQTCKNGESCQFKTQGRCTFYHRDVGVQQKIKTSPR